MNDDTDLDETRVYLDVEGWTVLDDGEFEMCFPPDEWDQLVDSVESMRVDRRGMMS